MPQGNPHKVQCIASPVLMYRKGAITSDHMLIQSLNEIDPENPGVALEAVPGELLPRMLEFARVYRPDGMVGNYGKLPTSDQVDAARRWIENANRPVTSHDVI